MMTPPCNIRARPVFTVKESGEPLVPLVALEAPLTGNSVAIVEYVQVVSTKKGKLVLRDFWGS